MPDRILVIDDEAAVLQQTVELLSLENFEVMQAGSGLEGLRIAREHLPDLIICDINMPEMTGFEVLAALREDSLTATIPFIFLSARTSQEDLRAGMVHGADDYLTKPIKVFDLIRAVHSRLARHANEERVRLRDYAHKLVITQEKERQALARLLKEKLGNQLSDLSAALGTISRLPAAAQTSALQAAQTFVSQIIDQLTNISFALSPSLLAQLGLLPAISLLFDRIEQANGINIDFSYQGIEEIADSELTIGIYRIIQEALENVRSHSGAVEVIVRLWVENETLRLHIQDEGRGFDVDRALTHMENIGILGMKEWARILRGELVILSAPDQGTRIYASFPLHTQREEMRVNVPEKTAPRAMVDGEKKRQGLRILIAEANDIVRWGMRSLIESQPNFQLAGEAGSQAELAALLKNQPGDILVTSLRFVEHDAQPSSLKAIRDAHPNMRILLISNFVEYAYVAQALKEGANGYLLKTSGPDELLNALHALAEGREYISKDITETTGRTDSSASENDSTLDAFSTLTEREREIFYYVIRGESNQQIADHLTISPRTVETHRLNMTRKLGLRGMPSLIEFAMHRGLIGNR